jgi:DNA-binding protein YbaB
MTTAENGLGSGGILDPEGAMADMQAWKGRIDRLAADTQTMSHQVGQLRVTASDNDDLVDVTIDSSGALTDIQFTQRVLRMAPEDVTRAVLEAAGAARLKAAERVQEVIAETMGPQSQSGRAIAERMASRLRGAGGAGEAGSDADYRV